MTTLTLANTPVEVDAEGFLARPEQWTRAMAGDIAARRRHRASSPSATGRSSPSCARRTSRPAPHRRSARSARPPAFPIKELYALFPKGPAKLAAKIAGIPKPRGCI